MIRLGVNIDHVATVRQARRAKEPDPVLSLTYPSQSLFGSRSQAFHVSVKFGPRLLSHIVGCERPLPASLLPKIRFP